jgi:hypothetical protein
MPKETYTRKDETLRRGAKRAERQRDRELRSVYGKARFHSVFHSKTEFREAVKRGRTETIEHRIDIDEPGEVVERINYNISQREALANAGYRL